MQPWGGLTTVPIFAAMDPLGWQDHYSLHRQYLEREDVPWRSTTLPALVERWRRQGAREHLRREGERSRAHTPIPYLEHTRLDSHAPLRREGEKFRTRALTHDRGSLHHQRWISQVRQQNRQPVLIDDVSSCIHAEVF